MSEIRLILSSSASEAPVTSVAIADTGMGVSVIEHDGIQKLRLVREQLEAMMRGAPRMTSNDLRRFGQAMREILFAGEVRDTANGIQGDIVAAILATNPRLKAIPWEYVAWPNGQSGPHPNNSVVRIVPQARNEPLDRIVKSDGLRILVLTASPNGLGSFSFGEFEDAITRAFASALPEIAFLREDDPRPETGRNFIRILEAATLARVRNAIKADSPHIVHFVGHGTSEGIALVDTKKRAAVVLSGTSICEALRLAPSIRLLILSACETADTTKIKQTDETVGVLAEEVVRNAVPAVIASQMVIDMRTVVLFCEGLYRELLSSGSIDLAIARGRCELAQLDEANRAAFEWGIPVLYRRVGAAQLF